MRLTTKGRFAVTAMIDLAMNAQTGAVKLMPLSERQSISLSYLEQLFSKLRRAGLVEAYAAPAEATSLPLPPSKSILHKSSPQPKTDWMPRSAAAKQTATTAPPV